jgi:hypothetical protein
MSIGPDPAGGAPMQGGRRHNRRRGSPMKKRLLQLAGIALIAMTVGFAHAKQAQACIHECVILCSPGTHCCIVGGCAGCYEGTACPPSS